MEGFRAHYIRDAQGNIMAIYKYTNSGTASTQVVERPIYGSSRLGSYAKPQEVMGAGIIGTNHTAPLVAADQRYELTDHLGNVNTVVSGRLLDGAGAGSQKQAEVLLAHGYEPFGALLPGRNYRQPLGPPPPPPETPKGTLVITEFSNGPSQANGSASGECEYVELYVTKCALYPDATEVDIRGWLIDDNAGNFNSSGCTTGVGITTGHLRFVDHATWASVPVGTVIVVFNGADNCYNFTSNETGSGGQYFINVGSSTLIERTTTQPSTTGCDYCGAAYAAPGSNPWNTIALGNTADAIQVRCPDCPASEAGFFHGVGYGSSFGGVNAGTNDLGGAGSYARACGVRQLGGHQRRHLLHRHRPWQVGCGRPDVLRRFTGFAHRAGAEGPAGRCGGLVQWAQAEGAGGALSLCTQRPEMGSAIHVPVAAAY